MGYLATGATGVTATSGAAASAAAALPTNSAGNPPRAVRVVADTAGYIKFGQSGVSATVNDILITTVPQCYWVGGFTHYSVIEHTAGAKINITPLEA